MRAPDRRGPGGVGGCKGQLSMMNFMDGNWEGRDKLAERRKAESVDTEVVRLYTEAGREVCILCLYFSSAGNSRSV